MLRAVLQLGPRATGKVPDPSPPAAQKDERGRVWAWLGSAHPDEDGEQARCSWKRSRVEAWAPARSAEESAHADRITAIAVG